MWFDINYNGDESSEIDDEEQEAYVVTSDSEKEDRELTVDDVLFNFVPSKRTARSNVSSPTASTATVASPVSAFSVGEDSVKCVGNGMSANREDVEGPGIDDATAAVGKEVVSPAMLAGGSATAMPSLRAAPIPKTLAELRRMGSIEVRGHLERFFSRKEAWEKSFRQVEEQFAASTAADITAANRRANANGTMPSIDAVTLDRYARLVNISNCDASSAEDRKWDVLLPAALVSTSSGATAVSSEAPHRKQHTLRSHQINGIRFLWSILSEGPVGEVPAVGCILAHTMGLGKTAQVVIFIHLFMATFHSPAHARQLGTLDQQPRSPLSLQQRQQQRQDEEKVSPQQRVLVVVPKSTQPGWLKEFATWSRFFPADKRVIPIVIEDGIRMKQQRVQVFRDWRKNGGVLLIGYEALVRLMQQVETDNALLQQPEKSPFAALGRSSGGGSGGEAALTSRQRAMSFRKDEGVEAYGGADDPFTELVVCDEAHRLKSSHLQVVTALRGLHPLRRLLLTGTPLQNHLQEYWAMVDFAMHKYFDRRRFNDFFVNPIESAANRKASSAEVNMARKKTFTLINEVKHFVQRVDSSPLKAELPRLHEYIVVVPLSLLQRELYQRFIKIVQNAGSERFPFLPAVSYAGKIAAHPQLLFQMKNGKRLLQQQQQQSAISPALAKLQSARGSGSSREGKGKGKASGAVFFDVDDEDEDAVSRVSFSSFSDAVEYEDLFEPPKGGYTPTLEDGTKLHVAMSIVIEAMRRGEKTLLFSLSTTLLDYFELLIAHINVQKRQQMALPRQLRFCRLDGSHSSAHRAAVLSEFDEDDGPDLFLLSTKAGGVGVTITAATRVVLVDTSFNPADDQQAIGRAYRYGQTKPVFVYRVLCQHTLEYSIFQQKLAKEWLFKTVVEEAAMKRDSLQGMHLREIFSLLGRSARALRKSSAASAAQRKDTAVVLAEDAVLAAAVVASGGGASNGASHQQQQQEKPPIVYAQEYGTFLEQDHNEQYGEDEEAYYKEYQRGRMFSVEEGIEGPDGERRSLAEEAERAQRQRQQQSSHLVTQGRTLTSMVDDLIRSRSATDPNLAHLLSVMGLQVDQHGVSSVSSSSSARPTATRIVLADEPVVSSGGGRAEENSTVRAPAALQARRKRRRRETDAETDYEFELDSVSSSEEEEIEEKDFILGNRLSQPMMLIDSDDDETTEREREKTEKRHARPVVPLVVRPEKYAKYRPGSSSSNAIDIA